MPQMRRARPNAGQLLGPCSDLFPLRMARVLHLTIGIQSPRASTLQCSRRHAERLRLRGMRLELPICMRCTSIQFPVERTLQQSKSRITSSCRSRKSTPPSHSLRRWCTAHINAPTPVSAITSEVAYADPNSRWRSGCAPGMPEKWRQ